MAVVKKINVGGIEVGMKASAAIPRLYRNKFGRDIFADLNKLQDGVTAEGGLLDTFSLELFENLAYIFCKHYDPEGVPESPDEWLEQFECFSIYEILPEILDLWGVNNMTLSIPKKNSAKRPAK